MGKAIGKLLGAERPKVDNSQKELLKKQEKREKLRLAEAKSDVERKKILMQRGGAGRSLLIKTSPVGVPGGEKLGG